MEGISRKDIDRACTILENHVNTEESIKLAKIIKEFDIIPKLYVYTYFKKVKQELKALSDEKGNIDSDELAEMIEMQNKLGLHWMSEKYPTYKKIKMFLYNGFHREKQFCDFDDSRYHDITRTGTCQCDEHDENLENKYYTNPEQIPSNNFLKLTAVFDSDEDDAKYDDNPQWWCKECCSGDFDIPDVSCDMDDDV